MSGTEETEFLFGWFFSLSWFLTAAGNTENISKQSLKLAVCILPVKFPAAHKLGSYPFTARGGRGTSNSSAEVSNAASRKGSVSPARGFSNLKRKRSFPWLLVLTHCAASCLTDASEDNPLKAALCACLPREGLHSNRGSWEVWRADGIYTWIPRRQPQPSVPDGMITRRDEG